LAVLREITRERLVGHLLFFLCLPVAAVLAAVTRLAF
jgi:hypothetical protein